MPASPPLLVVALIFRPRPEFDDVDHVITAVSVYVDSSVEQPLHKACKFGSVELLDRIWNSTVDLEPGGWGVWSVRNLLRTHELYGKYQFTMCLLEVAKFNRVDIAQWLFERFPYGVRREVICEAAKAGALEILKFFRTNGMMIGNDEENQYAEERERQPDHPIGGLEAARATVAKHATWIYAVYEDTTEVESDDSSSNTGLAGWVMDRFEMNSEGSAALLGAAMNGKVDVLQWFQDNGDYTEWDVGALIMAAEAGKLNVVQWIIERDGNDDELGYESTGDSVSCGTYITCLGGEASLAIHAAAINGHLEVAKYLYASIDKPRNKAERQLEQRRLSRTIYELQDCFQFSHPKSIDLIKEVSGETMALAAERGFLDVVKWLYTEYRADSSMNLFWARGFVSETGYSAPDKEFGSEVCSVVDAAASKGHLAIVQYLLQVGGNARNEPARKKRRPEAYSEQSIRYDDLPIVAACTTIAMDAAAANGHLDVVQWLHANCSQGCTADAMDVAAQKGHLETVKWLHANRSEGCTTEAMDGAAGNGHLEVVKWLHEHRSEGCTRSAMDNAAAGGHFQLLEWLHENRLEGCTHGAMLNAAAFGYLDIVKWLHKHGAQFTTRTMDAADFGNLRVLRWLLDNRKEEFTCKGIRFAALLGQYETVLILRNIQQQGLAKRVEVVDAEQLDGWIYDYYNDCMRLLVPEDQ